MKSLIGFTLLVFSLCLFLLTNSCKKDETKNCDRTCFFGTWTANDKTTGNSFTYETEIYASSADPDGIIIDNINGSPFEFEATVNGSSFTVPYQEVGQFEAFSGSGTLSEDGKTITVEYEEKYGELWTGTWTKQ